MPGEPSRAATEDLDLVGAVESTHAQRAPRLAHLTTLSELGTFPRTRLRARGMPEAGVVGQEAFTTSAASREL